MENYYYIPVNSLNFNNILSSESISPLSFYEKRGYGFKRFERINANPLSNSILAYSKILLLDPPKSDREEFPIHLAVPRVYFVDGHEEINIEGISILQTDASIYINWKECFFIVKNESAKNKLIAGTKRSLEVKHADLYIKNILLIDDYSFDTFQWEDSILESINDFKNANQNHITKDKKINKIKGLLYGFIAGKLKEQPDEITQGKRYFQDFINSYSVLMNELSVLSNDSKKNYGKVDKDRIATELEYLKDLKERINILFGGNEQLEIEVAIKSAFALEAEQIEFLKSLKYKKTRNTVFSIISTFLKERNNDLYSVDELLDILLQKAKSFVNYNSFSLYKTMDETFNSYRVLINSKISSYQKEVVSSNTLDRLPFTINKDLTILDSKMQELKRDEDASFRIVCNELLSRLELTTTDEIAQQRLDIIKNVGEALIINYKKDSNELEYLRKLYLSLKTVGVGFKVDESSNVALQALACFLSRYGELDKLQDFMERNKYNNYGVTYSLWGAAYGYANLSKILLEPLDSNKETLDMVYNYIGGIIYNTAINESRMIEFLNKNKAPEPQGNTREWKIDSNKVEEPRSDYTAEKSFSELIKSNSKLSNWSSTIIKSYHTIEKDRNISDMSFDKSYKIKEFERLLNEEKGKGNLNGFGKAKIEEAVLEFTKFINGTSD